MDRLRELRDEAGKTTAARPYSRSFVVFCGMELSPSYLSVLCSRVSRAHHR